MFYTPGPIHWSQNDTVSFSAEHEVTVLVHGSGPAGVHECARVVLLDNRRAVDDVPTEELPAVEHQGRAEAAHLREPDLTTALRGGRGPGAALGQRRAPGLRGHAHRGEPDV